MKYFALREELSLYKDSSRNELKDKLEKMGFEYHEPQMGGGGEVEIK